MITVLSVVGARPNFMKVAPLHRAFEATGRITSRIVHTGQHYDARMSDVFFRQLGLPEPHVYLGIAAGSHAQQTARVMEAFEQTVLAETPDVVVVVGDVNSTLACSLVAAKLCVPVVHVEAGLRSGDRTMPEEVNRLVTDAVSDHLYVTEQSGLDNLRREGVPDGKVTFAGNVMIDSLVRLREAAAASTVLADLGLEPGGYALMTMHRPANVDTRDGLAEITRIVAAVAQHRPVVFPVHPRTRARLAEFGLAVALDAVPGVHLMDPAGYLEFLHLMERAAVVVTDSGGIQEETTFLGVPCLTLRDSTERPVTVTLGTNVMLPLDAAAVEATVAAGLADGFKRGTVPPLWDGRAAERIAAHLVATFDTAGAPASGAPASGAA